jgi:nicotinate (nicotinamide) nucleotide adenylyltransferase
MAYDIQSSTISFTYDELSILAEEIRILIVGNAYMPYTMEEYIKKVKRLKLKDLGLRKLRAIQNESRLMAFFPNEIYEILYNRVKNIHRPFLNKSDNEYLIKNAYKGTKVLSDYFYCKRGTVERRLKDLGVSLQDFITTRNHIYTKTEDDFILSHFDKGPTWLGNKIGTSKHSIRRRKNVLSKRIIVSNHDHHYTQEDVDFIKNNYKKGVVYLSKFIGASIDSIYAKATRISNISFKVKDDPNIRTNVAILGGAFNPVTKGHIEIAEYVLKFTNIKEVWIIPCFSHMYNKDMANHEDRLTMCRLAIENEKIKVFDFEITNRIIDGTHAFLKKLLSLEDYASKYNFYYVIGMDNANEFDKWKKADILKETVPFIIVSRGGIDRTGYNQWYTKDLHILLNAGYHIIKSSSTDIRNWIKDGQYDQVVGYVCPKVLDYIKEKKLYLT